MRTRRALALLVVTAVGAGCAGDLPPQSRVDKLRVLAVRAEPPEVQPGQASALDALTALPPSEGAAPPAVDYLWLACRQTAGASAPDPCAVGASGDGGAAGTTLPLCASAPAASPCVIALAPTASYVAPAEAIASGDVGQVIVTLVAADAAAGGAVGCARAAASNGGAPPDPDHCVIALKRLTVSHAAAPNHNPTLDRLLFDGQPLSDRDVPRFAVVGSGEPARAAVDLRALRSPGSAEKKPDGTYEALYVSWFVTAGAVEASRTTFEPSSCDDACARRDLPPTVATRWDPPGTADAALHVRAGEARFWAVVRDDRGGVGWLSGHATSR